MEAEVRQTSVSGLDGPEEARSQELLLEAHATILVRPDAVSIAIEGKRAPAEPGAAAGDGRELSEETSTSTLYDYAGGEVWFREDGGDFSRRFLSELQYEENNRLRQQTLELLAHHVHLPWLRSLDLSDLAWGDLQVAEGPPEEVDGEETRVLYLAAEPGEVWEAVLAPPSSPLRDVASPPAFLACALGVSVPRAERILDRLGALPARVTVVRLVPAEASEVISETRFVTARRATSEELSSTGDHPPPDLVHEARSLDARFATVDSILAVLAPVARGERELPGLLTVQGLVLRLGRRLRPSDLEPVAELCAASGDSLIQVELARALLRSKDERAWALLKPLAVGEAGNVAMNVAEALVAERHPAALAVVAGILRRRSGYDDVEAGAVSEWAIRHLRLLSGLGLDRLIAAAESGGAAASPAAGGSADLDFWLRWSENEGARLQVE